MYKKRRRLYKNEQFKRAYLEIYPTLVDFKIGTRLVAFASINKMKKLSHKDLIIMLGVAVAAIIIVSSIYLKDSGQSRRSATQPVPERKIKPTVLIKKALERFTSKTHI
jgi:hypothetical protein